MKEYAFLICTDTASETSVANLEVRFVFALLYFWKQIYKMHLIWGLKLLVEQHMLLHFKVVFVTCVNFLWEDCGLPCDNTYSEANSNLLQVRVTNQSKCS